MLVVDNALQARETDGRPIRVALLGAGFMSRGLANHIVNTTREFDSSGFSIDTYNGHLICASTPARTTWPLQRHSKKLTSPSVKVKSS